MIHKKNISVLTDEICRWDTDDGLHGGAGISERDREALSDRKRGWPRVPHNRQPLIEGWS